MAPQHASAPGKSANCPTLVSQVLASCDVPVMIGLKLFLPSSRTSDAAAMDRVHGPEDARACIEQGEQAAIAAIPAIRQQVMGSADVAEGIMRFIQRRPAQLKGR